jgi:hypothetical protein
VAIAVIPALGRQRQEDCELEASLGYIPGTCWKEGRKKGRKER